MTNLTKQIDVILAQLGNIGWYQSKVYLLSCLPVFIAGSISISLVFITAVPDYRCFVNECDSRNKTYDGFNQTFLPFTIPIKTNRNSDNQQNWTLKQMDHCHVFESIHTNNYTTNLCRPDLFDQRLIKSCNDYVFDRKYFLSTAPSEFNLVCSSSGFVQILQSSFFVGILIGAIVNGIIADKFGRRVIFIIGSPALLVMLFFSALSPNAWFYVVSMVLKGVFCAGVYQSAFVVGIESVGGRWRFWLGNLHSIIFAIGGVYSCIMAEMFRSWRFVEYANIFPTILMLTYPFIFPESMRWQLSNGKIDDAVKQILQAAKTNGVYIPEDQIEAIYKSNDMVKNDDEPKASIFDLLTHKILRVWTLTLLYIWFTNSLVYYGLSFLSSEIDENIYFAMLLMCLVELPGILFTSLAVERFSRRITLMTVLIIGGLSCTAASFLPIQWVKVKLWLSIFGKMNISGSFSLIYVYTVEIFPTVLRISGLGLCSVFARVGGITAPYVLKLAIFGQSIPFMVIGVTSLIAGALCIILPETKDKKLPNTLDEVANLLPNSALEKSIIKHEKFSLSESSDDERIKLIENEM